MIVQRKWNKYAAYTNGVDSFFTFARTGLEAMTTVTFSVWFTVHESLATASGFNFTDNNVGSRWFWLSKAGTSDTFALRANFSSSGSTTIFTPTVVNPYVVGQRYHAVWQFDGTTYEGFMDGTSCGTVNRAGQNVAWGTATTHRMGRNSGTAYRRVTFDEVSVWNTVKAMSDLRDGSSPKRLTNLAAQSDLLRYYRMGDKYIPGSGVIENEGNGGNYPMTLNAFDENADFRVA
jgi:hypothetical protein